LLRALDPGLAGRASLIGGGKRCSWPKSAALVAGRPGRKKHASEGLASGERRGEKAAHLHTRWERAGLLDTHAPRWRTERACGALGRGVGGRIFDAGAQMGFSAANWIFCAGPGSSRR